MYYWQETTLWKQDWGLIENMIIAGQITTREEAREIEYIQEIFIVSNRVKILATSSGCKQAKTVLKKSKL